MLQEFRSPEGATILDVCLNVYLSLNLLSKFVKDNNITDLNKRTKTNELFIFDTDYIYNEFQNLDVKRNDYIFRTSDFGVLSSKLNKVLMLASTDVLASTDLLCSEIYE